PASRELLGIEPSQLLGKSFADMVSDKDAPLLLRTQHELKTLGSQSTILVRGSSAYCKNCWLEVSLKRVRGARGIDEIVVNCRDVTQRHTYQLAIEEIHKRNARILDATGDGVVSLNSNCEVVYANEVALRWLGLEVSHVINTHWCDLVSGLDLAHAQSDKRKSCPFMQTLADGETRSGMMTLRQQVQTPPVAASYVCTPLRESDTVTGSVIVFNEGTRGEDGNQAQQTQVILDQAVEAVMVTDAKGIIQSVNRAFTEITGYSAEEAMGQAPRILRSGVHTPNFYDEFWRTLTEERCWRGEIWNKRKNGEIYPQWGSVTTILDGSGAVKNYIAVFSDTSKAKQAEDKLQYLASHDTLTGLPNRTNFSEQLGRIIDRSRRTGTSIAVVFVDIDHFKTINATLGHSVGDTFLKRIAERLMSVTRKDDILARWGGDEFVLAFKDISRQTAIAETLVRLLTRLAEPLILTGHELIPAASIGVSVYPEDAMFSSDLIKAADAAMYRAKKQGRNCFVFYTQQMQTELDNRFEMAIEMRRGLTAGEFRLFYQPQVHAQTGCLVGAEALIRWQHPTRGLLAPIHFIPLSEEIGLISELGEWVLREACRQQRKWKNSGITVPRLAVNVSPQQLKPQFVDSVVRYLHESALEPSCLELEITEGVLDGS
ncbi:MAG: diguanylate cyclase, partial [Methylococcaceae bacterium]|nr:diguanylate cyclase [Methylococcaceae bacterium]